MDLYLCSCTTQSCDCCRVAHDASSLVQLGLEDGDPRLIMAGKRLYVKALRLLVKQVSDQTAAGAHGVVSAICSMQVCDFFVAMEDQTTWRQHAKGLHVYLQYAQIAGGAIPGFREMLDINVRLFGLWDELLSRRKVDTRRPMDSSTLISVAENVPGVPAVSFTLLDIAPDDRNNPFPLVFRFKTLEDALNHTACTGCLLSLRESNLRMLLPGEHANLKSITDCADSLCMSIPYMCLPDNGGFGMVVSVGPLHLANKWYESLLGTVNVEEKLAWCHSAAAHIQQRGIRTL